MKNSTEFQNYTFKENSFKFVRNNGTINANKINNPKIIAATTDDLFLQKRLKEA